MGLNQITILYNYKTFTSLLDVQSSCPYTPLWRTNAGVPYILVFNLHLKIVLLKVQSFRLPSPTLNQEISTLEIFKNKAIL